MRKRLVAVGATLLTCPVAVVASTLIFLIPLTVFAQGGILNDSVLRADGKPAVGATVRVCTEAASGTPCSPTASIFSDKALTIGIGPTLAVDAAGAYTYYASPGFYKEQLCLGATCATRTVLMAGDVTALVVGTTAVPFSATPTFDSSTGVYFSMTLTGNVTSSTISNASDGRIIYFNICQDATGGRTFTWPASVLTPPTVGTAASSCTSASFIYDGTNWRELAASSHGSSVFDTSTIGVLNNIRVVDGNKFTTIQAAIDDLGSTEGIVLIPASYAGADASSVPANVLLIHFRPSVDGTRISFVVKNVPGESPLSATAFNESQFAIARTATLYSGANVNEWGVLSHFFIPSSLPDSTVSYEKAGMISRFVTQVNSASDYSIVRGGLALDARGIISGGATHGDTLGAIATAEIAAGSDGRMTALETNVVNEGSSVSTYDDTTLRMKNGVWISSTGTNPGTTALAAVIGSWHHGLVIKNIEAGGDAILIPNNRPVKARNFADNADWQIFTLDASDRLRLGGPDLAGIVIEEGIAFNSSGFKHKRFASGTTAASLHAIASATWTFSAAFADTNYTTTCTVDNPTGVPIVAYTITKLNTSINIVIMAGSAAAASGTLNCIAVHDG